MSRIILLIVLQICSLLAFAQSEDKFSPSAKLLLEGGIEYGGDEILKVYFTNGGDQTMLAGQGGYVSVGGQFDIAKPVMIRASIGFKYNTTAADNANIRFTRLPINLVGYYKINQDFRLGLGATSHQAIKLKGDGFIEDVSMTSNIGGRFEFGYKWAALTYTAITYEDEDGEQFSANSIGFSLSFLIPDN